MNGLEATALQRVWEPLTVADVVIPNRLMMTPHGTHYHSDGVPTDRVIAYYEERARGGAGLIAVNGTLGHRYALGGGTQKGSNGYEERCVPHYARLAEAVQRHGARIFVELSASGVRDHPRTFHDAWHPVWGMSRVPSPADNQIPAVMDQEYLDTLVSDFAQSSANMQAAGVDGVELHGAHGYLFMQSLSPAFNKRTDRYGGSPRRRCQLLIEVATAIRERVGDGFPVGLRYSFDEFGGEGTLTPELSEEYLDILSDTGLFSHFDVSAGGFDPHKIVMPMGGSEEGYLVPYGARAKAVVGDRARVFIVGRIRSVEMAEQILADGAADMVALLRAQIADPQLVAKARAGRSHETVRCIGGNECISAAEQGREVACTVNPIAGRERQWSVLPPSAQPRSVAIIGAGPAGLRCAATAAQRGHSVTVYERERETGGHLGLLRRLPTREDWGFLVDDLEAAARRAGVTFNLSVDVDAALLEQLDHDVIVLATGSTWDRTGFTAARPSSEQLPGADSDHVLDVATATQRALADPRALGARVLIVDETGGYLPLGLADVLSSAGVQVNVVTRHLAVGQSLVQNYEAGIVFPRLVSQGVDLSPQRLIEEIDGQRVHVAGIWGGAKEVLDGIDTVVLAMLRSPVDALWEPASQLSARVVRIGDALAPRSPAEAIFEAEQLAREL